MAIDPEQVKAGLSTAEAIGTLLGGLGFWEGAKYAVGLWAAARQRKRDAEAARLKGIEDAARGKAEAEQKLQVAETQQAREIRRDTVQEWQTIAAERQQEKRDCHERLTAVEAEMLECREDRAALRSKLEAIDKRVTKVENGHG